MSVGVARNVGTTCRRAVAVCVKGKLRLPRAMQPAGDTTLIRLWLQCASLSGNWLGMNNRMKNTRKTHCLPLL